MNKKHTTLLILLIILTFTSFTRSFIYILFDRNLISIDNKLGFDAEPTVNNVLLIFSIIRLMLTIIILSDMNIQFNLLTLVLFYFIFTAILRFYYQYLYLYKPNSKEKRYIDKYQYLNSFVIFLSSSYILYYIFFK